MDEMERQVRGCLDGFYREVREAGEELLDRPLPEASEELFGLYEKTGNRLTYEAVYFERRKALVVLGLLSLWYHKKDDLEKLCGVIQKTCAERTWALPAHVDRAAEGWERTVDLFACETGQTLAELTALLGDELPPDVRDLVRREVTKRLVDSYMEQPFGAVRWEKFRNNWVAVCAGCLGSIAMYLLGDDKEKQEACIRRAADTMPLYLEGMLEDGTCPEGMSYYSYGMAYFVGFADQLYTFSKGRVDLLDDPKVERIARFQQLCFFDGGCTVSFSDGERKDKFRLGLTCYLAMRYPGVEIPPMESVMKLHDDGCYRFMALYRDGLWAERFLNQKNASDRVILEKMDLQREAEWFHVLPDAQWAIGRSDHGVCFAIKGGHNDEPHNHNDVGSFLYVRHGEIFLTDLGCGEYTKAYFREGRYEILCNRSLGHSVPLADGKEQQAGREHCAESFRADVWDGGGTLRMSWRDGSVREEEPAASGRNTASVSFSMARAYPGGTAVTLVRQAVLDKEDGSLCLTDRCRLAGEGRVLTENFVTQLAPSLREDGVAALLGKKSLVTLRVCSCTGQNTGGWRARKESFINHQGNAEDVWLLQWEMACGNQTGECVIEICAEDLIH